MIRRLIAVAVVAVVAVSAASAPSAEPLDRGVELHARPTRMAAGERAAWIVSRYSAWDGGSIRLEISGVFDEVVITPQLDPPAVCTSSTSGGRLVVECTSTAGVDIVEVSGRVVVSRPILIAHGSAYDGSAEAFATDYQFVTGMHAAWLPLVNR